MKSNWNYPTTVWVGENRVKELSVACEQIKIKNPLFVTDNDLANLPMVQNIILQLKSKFKNSYSLSKKIIALPISPYLTFQNIDFISEKIRNFFLR